MPRTELLRSRGSQRPAIGCKPTRWSHASPREDLTPQHPQFLMRRDHTSSRSVILAKYIGTLYMSHAAFATSNSYLPCVILSVRLLRPVKWASDGITLIHGKCVPTPVSMNFSEMGAQFCCSIYLAARDLYNHIMSITSEKASTTKNVTTQLAHSCPAEHAITITYNTS